MSREKENSFKNFLDQDGYLFVFTLVCAACLLSFFVASGYFEKENPDVQVLGTTSSSIKGVWFRGSDDKGCSEAESLEVDGCIESSYFSKFTQLNAELVSFDEDGRVLFSNDQLFISGIFDIREYVDSDLWEGVYVGDLNLKINSRQWVFENMVWSRDDSFLISIFKKDDGYFILLYPSVTLTNRSRNFWVFEYLEEGDTVEKLVFDFPDGRRAYIESTFGSVLEKDGDLFFMFERLDPSLGGNSEVDLFRFGSSLEFFKSFLLLKE
jgi:hypothetical protein